MGLAETPEIRTLLKLLVLLSEDMLKNSGRRAIFMTCTSRSEEGPSWSDLPVTVLTQIFDCVLKATTPHPIHLAGKLSSWSSLFRTCKHWKAAIMETEVGVCLPTQIDGNLETWLRLVRLRGLELHDPDHTPATLFSNLLNHPQLLSRSGASMQSLVDVPLTPLWRPSAFTNLTQLVLRRFIDHQNTAESHEAATFDVSVLDGMKHLKVLVLSAGFNGLLHIEHLPSSCKTLVINSQGSSQSSYISITAWPPAKVLDSLYLSAYTLQIDFSCLKGCVRELIVHTAFLLMETAEAASTGQVNRRISSRREQFATAVEDELNLTAKVDHHTSP
ncbi:hypothetical protein CEUSTIGMA_g4598.t1 [Chlamydomonas eustigma]|uniref:F-box domain-containing protein n=1 Tax=Chlamydomonas eustigma TaxID=1157962 RepID=A0A250X235_9CHLO|nr:hypothetical protein CEUSTIGMA_g4598.t1 [Chlamydomonas eustigma]|eukprot:GAX77153.1 hypothetical protein CEUSTIGMA_g4598.t1 [Chlamydomonas eustigma]